MIDRDFIRNGFLSGMETIMIGVYKIKEETDHMGFVRDHIKNNVTALKVFDIEVCDNTNIDALIDILSVSPNAWSFSLSFFTPKLTSQQAVERYWKIILAVIYCNANKKTISVRTYGYFMDEKIKRTFSEEYASSLDNEDVSLDWSFIEKPEYNKYRKVQAPGIVENFNFCGHAREKNWKLFFTAPIWSQLSIENLTCPLVSHLEDQVSNVTAKCVKVKVDFESLGDSFPCPSWAHFAKYDKLEIHIDSFNWIGYKVELFDLVSCFKHPNLHLVLGRSITVSDAYPDILYKYKSKCWKLNDVKRFANSITCSSVRSLTYKIFNDNLKKRRKKTVGFDCDEEFPSKFMDFLKTQPIYSGNCEEYFLTLQAAKESFEDSDTDSDEPSSEDEE